MPSCRRRLFVLCGLALAGSVAATDLRDANAVPQLGPRGIDSYKEFLASGMHRAFAIAPGGAWAWRADLPSRELAVRTVLDDCRGFTQQTCVAYAADDQLVFDAKAWPTLWGPYADASRAAQAKIGVNRGERFPDIRLRDPDGKPAKVSDYRGQVVVLHFWGSWCGPCRRELPDLQKLVKGMATSKAVRFVFVPVREPLSTSRDWLKQQKLELPLYDAGSGESFVLADGAKLPDRQVAGKFPTTYVLDKHGLVVFSHIGDASRWEEVAPFLKDTARLSGK